MDPMQTLVIGHRNPDMDAICSAIGYAEFKRATGHNDVVAGRCGNTNARVDYALERFGFAPPQFFSDVRPQVRDVMRREVVTVREDEPVNDAFARIGRERVHGLPVLDAADRCIGMISGYKISRQVFPELSNIERSREVHASLDAIRRTVGAELLAGPCDNVIRDHLLIVVAMQTDTFRGRLQVMDRDRAVLIVGDRRNIQTMAVEAGVRALLISSHLPVDPALLREAEARGTTLLSSPWDTATTVLLARSAVSARHLFDDEFLWLEPEATLEDARARVALSPQYAFPVLSDGRLAGILSKSDFLKPVPRQLILVDHNELTQAVAGASELAIAEIIDHHRIGAPPTTQPILFLNRPVGSTCSIVADCYEREGIPIPPNVAGLLMCGLISDTLNLTSPTTTDFDRALMRRLSDIAGVRPGELSEKIFSVGSPLLTMPPSRAITADCKEYEEHGRRFSVAQIEEITFSHFHEKRAELLDALEAYRAGRGYDFSAMLVTDINTQNSFLLVRGSESLRSLIDFPEDGENVWRLDGIVSRKKQLLPYLSSLVARVGPQ